MEEPKPQSMQRSRGQDSQVGGTMQVLYLLLCTSTSVSCAKLWEFPCSTKAQWNWNKLSLWRCFFDLTTRKTEAWETWEWILSVWESSKQMMENHVCFLSAFCKSICVLCRSFQASFSLILMLAPRYSDEVDAFSSKLVSDERGRGRERGRERREKRKDSGNGLEDPRQSATSLHPQVWVQSVDGDNNVERRAFT